MTLAMLALTILAIFTGAVAPAPDPDPHRYARQRNLITLTTSKTPADSTS
ncbi:hypothetical protein GCM10009835_12490 [Planosporangium flavigriseum]|uniref:Uncharacterized protein n=1 Tax=Planosporangium flavigriseum TaxID=373681 RepID=A0A8J3LW96_9ACTN|nr:hypothetical protein Pfl04_33830 [Planosporangium flavigriseum]